MTRIGGWETALKLTTRTFYILRVGSCVWIYTKYNVSTVGG